MVRTMSELQIKSISAPFDRPPSALLALQLLSRAQTMGLLRAAIDESAVTLDRRTVLKVMERLQEAGLASAPAMRFRTAPDKDIAGLLQETIEALDASPYPSGEWEPLRELVGDELLARMLRISESSVRRYGAGDRRTPEDVAWRLHAIGRIASALRGSYNSYGVRRWFERSRTALDGRTPAQIIAEAENEDEADLVRVIQLAEALIGAGVAA